MPEEVAVPPVTDVEPASMSALKALHTESEIRFGRLHDDVMMGVHQATRDCGPAKLSDDPLETVEERDSVAVVLHDGATSVSLGNDVMDCAKTLLTRHARHAVSINVVCLDYKCPNWTIR
jgi:hypothetical protein